MVRMDLKFSEGTCNACGILGRKMKLAKSRLTMIEIINNTTESALDVGSRAAIEV